MNSKRPWLLVEDDSVDEQAFRRAASHAGLGAPIICVTSAEDAVQRVQDLPRPLVIVLDLNLPGRGGLDAIPDLRRCGIPLVVLTTSRDERDIAAAFAAGVAGFFAKPLDRAAYQETVANLVRYWQLSEEAP